MGCAWSKTSAVEDSRESPRKRLSSSSKKYSELNKLNSYRRREREERAVVVSTSSEAISEPGDSKPANGVPARLPKAGQAEQVAAGWPVWLSAAASEAIKGWVPRRADTFEKLYKIGQGTYSSVYKARDIVNNRFVALKKVRFDNLDAESVKFMAREILVLRRLDHPNIIKLEGLIASPNSCSLYLVFEYMEHDLTGLASRPEIKFTESQVKCYMQQLLRGLEHCHSHKVLHRDIKGSNLLIDNNGVLKIADFGLASFYDPQQRQPLTSRVVTLWYRPPELLLGASHYGVAVDLWSAGCILGELYSGKPILPGKTEVEQLHKIFKLCGSPSEEYWSRMKLRHSAVMRPPQPYRRCVSDTFRELPAAAVSLIETLLSVDPASRQTADLALKAEFFTTKPLACDPSSLPEYPPSKEIDAKLREDEARRQRALSGRGHNVDLERRGGPLGTHPPHPPNVNLAMMVRQDHSSAKSHSEILGHRREVKTVSGMLVEPVKPSRDAKDPRRVSGDDVDRRVSMSGPLGRRPRPVAERNLNDPLAVSARPNFAKLSSSVAAGRTPSCDQKPGPSFPPEVSFEDQRQRSFKIGGHDEKACSKDSSLYGHGSKTDKIYVSGPLLVSSNNNVEQMLKDHDRRIQEFARKTRLAKPGSGSRHQSHVAA